MILLRNIIFIPYNHSDWEHFLKNLYTLGWAQLFYNMSDVGTLEDSQIFQFIAHIHVARIIICFT